MTDSPSQKEENRPATHWNVADRRALVADPHRVRQGVARFVTARHYDKSAIFGPDVGELPGDVDARFRVHAPVHYLVVLADAGRVGVRLRPKPCRSGGQIPRTQIES